MTILEENNLTTQIELMRGISENYSHILYSVTETGNKLFQLLNKGTFNKDENRYSFEKETADEILALVRILQDERRFEELGVLAKIAVPNNKVKKEILNSLRKGL